MATIGQRIKRQYRRWQRSEPGSRSRRRSRAAIKRLKQLRAEVVLAGRPWWGGGKRIIRDEVWPIVKSAGIAPTSGKRSETFGNPGSDHFILNIWAFAKDFATGNNQSLAQKIRSKLTPGQTHHDYEEFYFERFGHTYRGQIIASTHGSGPHLHIGIRRVD